MNRREFIKAGTGAFAIAASGRLFGANAPSNRLRFAVMGCHPKGRGLGHEKALFVSCPYADHGRAYTAGIPYVEMFVKGRLPLSSAKR